MSAIVDGLPETRRASRRGIWSWMLFDWAQQPFHTLIITFVFAPYFASAVATDSAQGQAYWGYAAGIGGFLIAISSPVLGAIADASGPRKPWIFGFSVLGVIGCFMLWWVVPGMPDMTFFMIAMILALVGMEFAAVFNNAMMPDLVPRSELGRLSGSAWGLGYVGGIITLVLVLGFLAAPPTTGKTLFGLEPLFGLDPAMREGDRASGPLTALWFVIFALPMFLFTPDAARRPSVGGAVSRGLKELGATLRSLPRQGSYFSFLMSSMFYRDALNALYSFGGIYAAGVLGWSIIQIGIFGILANLTGALGAWFGGRLDQRYGPKYVVSLSIVLLTLCCILVISTTRTDVLFMDVTGAGSATVIPTAVLAMVLIAISIFILMRFSRIANRMTATVTMIVAIAVSFYLARVIVKLLGFEMGVNLPDAVFYVAGALIGAAGGSIQAASRTLLVDQVPREKVTEAFGLYALSGKATTFIGPLAIALATTWFASEAFGLSTEDAQRLGVTPIIALFLIGLVMLPWVKSSALYDKR